MEQLCTRCGSSQFSKNGSYNGVQRYKCKSCMRYFSDKPRKFTYQQKAKAIQMYLNNVGIGKIAKFINCSAASVVDWIKVLGKQISDQLQNNANKAASQMPAIIEMDEMYTFVKKQQRAVIWLAYCRGAGRVVSYLIEEGKEAAIQLYKQVKSILANISCIYTDANSCYGSAFAEHQVKESPITTKAETHLIESANSRIRDNLARFNRRSKRFSKSWEMLQHTLLLFFNQDKMNMAV